jgi:hypothetical protein
MNAAMLGRISMFESSRRDRLYTAWVKQINIDQLLEEDPQQRIALLSKNIIKKIAGMHLLDSPPANLAPASFAPDELQVGLTLSNMNGLDYRVLTMSLNTPSPGFLTTRFSDQGIFRFRKRALPTSTGPC